VEEVLPEVLPVEALPVEVQKDEHLLAAQLEVPVVPPVVLALPEAQQVVLLAAPLAVFLVAHQVPVENHPKRLLLPYSNLNHSY